MREILFRGKRIDNRKWVEGNVVNSECVDKEYNAIIIPKKDSGMFTNGEPKASNLGFEEWSMVDPETVCQYTGLTDKNGRKIFDGDIVKIGLEQYEVWWNCDSSSLTLSNENESRGLYLSHSEIIEIIGNIFDNPELIGE